MRKEKGYDRLLRICHRLVQDGERFHLTIVGGGSEFNEIEKLQAKLDLDTTVTLLGNQENPYPYLKQADLFLLPSYSEGFSTVLIEAIILGIPALVTECAGMDEILEHGKYGIIVSNDEDSIYKSIRKILEDHSILEPYKKLLPERKDFF